MRYPSALASLPEGFHFSLLLLSEYSKHAVVYPTSCRWLSASFDSDEDPNRRFSAEDRQSKII